VCQGKENPPLLGIVPFLLPWLILLKEYVFFLASASLNGLVWPLQRLAQTLSRVMIVIKSGLQRCCVWGRCNMILTTYIFLTAAQNGPLRSQTYLCLTAKGKWSICATLCQVYTNSFTLSLSVSSWVFVCCLSKISSQFWNLSKCVLILMNNVKFNYAEVTAFKMEMSTQCHKSNQPSTMSCFTRNIIFSSRQLFDFALLPPCISDWASIRADCIWELPVCHQLRQRQHAA